MIKYTPAIFKCIKIKYNTSHYNRYISVSRQNKYYIYNIKHIKYWVGISECINLRLLKFLFVVNQNADAFIMLFEKSINIIKNILL